MNNFTEQLLNSIISTGADAFKIIKTIENMLNYSSESISFALKEYRDTLTKNYLSNKKPIEKKHCKKKNKNIDNRKEKIFKNKKIDSAVNTLYRSILIILKNECIILEENKEYLIDPNKGYNYLLTKKDEFKKVIEAIDKLSIIEDLPNSEIDIQKMINNSIFIAYMGDGQHYFKYDCNKLLQSYDIL